MNNSGNNHKKQQNASLQMLESENNGVVDTRTGETLHQKPTTRNQMENDSEGPIGAANDTNASITTDAKIQQQEQESRRPSVSSLTYRENSRQSTRMKTLHQKLHQLASMRRQFGVGVDASGAGASGVASADGMARRFSDDDLDRMDSQFRGLLDEIQGLWSDYKQSHASAEHPASSGVGARQNTRKQSRPNMTRNVTASSKQTSSHATAATPMMDFNDTTDFTMEDMTSAQGNGHQSSISTHTNSTQQKVSERLRKLIHSEQEFDNLEQEIFNYEKKHGIQSTRNLSKEENKIEKNKEALRNFNERKYQLRDEGFRKREERSIRAKQIKKKVNTDLQRYTRQLSRDIDHKLQRASERKIQLQYDTKMAELKMKWSYLISFWVRMLILAGRLEDDRKKRAADAKQERLTKVVYTRMMPIVWKRRSERWQECWSSFQHHWTLYQLWLTTKKKKRATAIIKSFLQDTQSSLQLVTQVQHFKEKIRKCQEYVRLYHHVHKSRMMALLLQYSIVESKLINGEPLLTTEKKMKMESATTKEDSSHGATPRKGSARGESSHKTSARGSSDKKSKSSGRNSSRPTSSSSTTRARPSSKRKGRSKHSKAKKKKSFLHRETKDIKPDALCLARPSYEMRMELLSEVYRKRREAYLKDLSEYTSVLRLYEQKYRQFIHYQRAQAILKDETVDLPENDEIELSNNDFNPFEDKLDQKGEQLVDEDGEVIPRPTEPFFSIHMSEVEMEEIVMRGFQRVRDFEEEEYERLVLEGKADNGNLIRVENQHLKTVMKVSRELQSYYGDLVYEKYSQSFAKANTAATNYIIARRDLKTALDSKKKAKKSS